MELEQKGYLIGFDIQDKYSQISFYDEESKEPISVGEVEDSYLIPNTLFWGKESRRWYTGNEAISQKGKEKGRYFDQLCKPHGTSQSVTIHNQVYTSWDLLAIQIRQQLIMLSGSDDLSCMERICFTTDCELLLRSDFTAKLSQVLEIPPERLFLQHHMTSYLYFVIHQESSIWQNNVGLFEYREDGLLYYQMEFNRRMHPVRVRINCQSFQRDLGPGSYLAEGEIVDEIFGNVVKKVMERNIVSGVFLSGIGFDSQWLNASLKILCSGRRAFIGQNLFTKGACYALVSDMALLHTGYLILAPELVNYDIGIEAEREGKQEWIPIVQGGQEWFLTSGNITVFLEGNPKIDLLYRSRETQEVERGIIVLDGLPKRKNKATKLQIGISFTSMNRGFVTVKDLGFGSFYPSSHLVFTTEFQLD